VVLDWMLPGRSGIDLLADLRAKAETRDLPVVLLSAKARDEDIWAGWQAGANYYLTKPFRIEQLLYYLEALRDQANCPAAGRRPGRPRADGGRAAPPDAAAASPLRWCRCV